MSGWSSFRHGSGQRLPGGGGTTAAEPQEVIVAGGVGEVTVEKVLQNLGRHLLVVVLLDVIGGRVRRDLDRGAAPPRLRPEARRGRATVQVSPHTTTDNIQEDDDEEMAAKILQDFLDGHFANAAGDDDFLGLSGRSTATARKTLTAAVPKRGPSTHTLRSSIDNESERAYISPSLL